MNLLAIQGQQPSNITKTTIEINPIGWVIIGAILIVLIIGIVMAFKDFNSEEETPETNNNIEKRYCKYCGKEISKSSTYCEHCQKKQD